MSFEWVDARINQCKQISRFQSFLGATHRPLIAELVKAVPAAYEISVALTELKHVLDCSRDSKEAVGTRIALERLLSAEWINSSKQSVTLRSEGQGRYFWCYRLNNIAPELLFELIARANGGLQPKPQCRELKGSEKVIVDLIRELGRPQTTSQILAEIERRQLGLGESTVKLKLSLLVKNEILLNGTTLAGRGYRLPEWG